MTAAVQSMFPNVPLQASQPVLKGMDDAHNSTGMRTRRGHTNRYGEVEDRNLAPGYKQTNNRRPEGPRGLCGQGGETASAQASRPIGGQGKAKPAETGVTRLLNGCYSKTGNEWQGKVANHCACCPGLAPTPTLITPGQSLPGKTTSRPHKN